MLRIESDSDGQTKVLRLIGRLKADHVDELKKQLDGAATRRVVDLEEVTLVDVEVVRFLGDCEDNGIELSRCTPYIREWINRERHGRSI
jgi:hypothetical protein